MFETGRAALPSLTDDAASLANADFSWKQGEVADAARPEERAILGGEPFFWLSVRRPALGNVRDDRTSPTATFYGG
jgi:hypothetical protein